MNRINETIENTCLYYDDLYKEGIELEFSHHMANVFANEWIELYQVIFRQKIEEFKYAECLEDYQLYGSDLRRCSRSIDELGITAYSFAYAIFWHYRIPCFQAEKLAKMFSQRFRSDIANSHINNFHDVVKRMVSKYNTESEIIILMTRRRLFNVLEPQHLDCVTNSILSYMF